MSLLFEPAPTLHPDLAALHAQILQWIGDLTRVELSYKPSQIWASFGAFTLPPNKVTADDLITSIAEQFEQYTREHGRTTFKVVCYTAHPKGKDGEKAVITCELAYGETAGASTKDGETVALLRELREDRRMMFDQVKEAATSMVASIQAFVGIQTQSAEMMKAHSGNSDAIVQIARMKHEREMSQAEAEANEMRISKGLEALDKVLLAWMSKGAETASTTPGKETIPGTLDGIFTSLDDDQRAKLAEIVGQDAWDILQGAAACRTDIEAKAVLVKLAPIWGRMPKDDGMRLMGRISEVIGPQKLAQLMLVLRNAGIAR